HRTRPQAGGVPPTAASTAAPTQSMGGRRPSGDGAPTWEGCQTAVAKGLGPTPGSEPSCGQWSAARRGERPLCGQTAPKRAAVPRPERSSRCPTPEPLSLSPQPPPGPCTSSGSSSSQPVTGGEQRKSSQT